MFGRSTDERGREPQLDPNPKTETVTKPAAPQAQAPAAPQQAAPAAPAQPSGDVHAYFGKGSKISGKLNFEGTVRVDGKVDGEIHAKETLVIGESAEVTAEIHGKTITVLGIVRGDIRASERLELKAPGKLYGNIQTPSLVISEGVVFEGACLMENLGARDEGKVQPLERKQDAAQQQAPQQQQKNQGQKGGQQQRQGQQQNRKAQGRG